MASEEAERRFDPGPAAGGDGTDADADAGGRADAGARARARARADAADGAAQAGALASVDRLRLLHPLTLFFAAGAVLRAYLVPALILLAWVQKPALVLALFAAASAASLLRAGLAYAFFRYGVVGHELVTRAGIIATEERHLPLTRIQDIKIEATLVERALGLASVEIETAGGERAEVALRVVSRAEADALAETVRLRRERALERSLGRRGGGAASGAGAAARARRPPREELLAELGTGELLLAGVTSTRASIVVVVAGGFLLELADLVPAAGRPLEAIAALALGALARSPALGAAIVLAIAGAALALGLGLAALLTAIRFHGFALARRGDELRRHHGLFTRRASSLPERRIQAVLVDEGGARRLFGLAAVHAVSAGSTKGGIGEASEGRDVVLPIGGADEAWELAGMLVPGRASTRARAGPPGAAGAAGAATAKGAATGAELAPEPAGEPAGASRWERPSRLGALRFGVSAALVAVAVGVGLALLATAPLGWLAGGVGVALAPLLAELRYRRLGYALDGEVVLVRKGYIGVKTHLVPLRKLQSAAVARGPLERALGLARVQLDTAGQPILDRPEIPDLAAADAARLAERLSQRAAALPFRW